VTLLNNLKKYGPHFLLWGFLMSPLPVSMLMGEGQGRVDELSLFNAFASMLWAAVLSGLFRRPLYLHLTLVPFYLTAAADLFLLKSFGNRLSSAYIGIALSDHGEASEFISFYLTPILLIAIPSICLISGSIFSLRKQRFSVFPLRLTFLVALLFGLYGVAFTKNALSGMDARRNLLDISAKELSSPFGVLFQSALAFNIQREYQEVRSVRKKNTAVEAATTREGRGEIYVLVIGESSRPDNWSLFGYEKNTNPRLSKQDGLVLLPDFVTSAPHTSVAVPAMLSLKEISDWPGIMAAPSIVNIFNAAGFDTYWMSTQEADSWGGHIPILAREAGRTIYFDRAYDGVMLKDLDLTLSGSRGNDRALIVLHSKGSHWQYKRRYPSEFNAFGVGAPNKIDQVVAEYDNSILYTDWFLAEIIGRLQALRRPVFLLYASDHGENINDGGSGIYGHAIGNRYDLRAAAFYWMSAEMRAQLAVSAEQGRMHARRPLSASNISHSLLGLAGIRSLGFDPSKDIFSNRFSAGHRPYLVRGQYHADAAPALYPRASTQVFDEVK
jgi:glucan phosphoethanolaminetransferase (alkaline phosphatase superfamily)